MVTNYDHLVVRIRKFGRLHMGSQAGLKTEPLQSHLRCRFKRLTFANLPKKVAKVYCKTSMSSTRCKNQAPERLRITKKTSGSIRNAPRSRSRTVYRHALLKKITFYALFKSVPKVTCLYRRYLKKYRRSTCANGAPEPRI